MWFSPCLITDVKQIQKDIFGLVHLQNKLPFILEWNRKVAFNSVTLHIDPMSYIVFFFFFFNDVKLYCKTDWQCYSVPEGFCHFQTYRSNVEALSRAVSAEGLLPLAWQSLLVALGLIAISATFVPSLTTITMWLNDNIKKKDSTGKAWVGTMKRIRISSWDCYDQARALRMSKELRENTAVPKTTKR